MLYAGPAVGDAETRLISPELDRLNAVEIGERDDLGSWIRWRQEAQFSDKVVYFAIECDGDLVGEIFLHDIDVDERTGMVGYRIFEQRDRGSGTGTTALRHLVGWAAERGSLDRLFGIARADNLASCRILEKAGFWRLGPAREDPDHLVHEIVLTTVR